MTSSRALFAIGAAYAVAWALPVIKGGVTLPEGLPGWQAFRVAASPVWPYDDFRYDTWYAASLAVASAATNLLMLATPWLVVRRERSLHRLGALTTAAAFLVNAHWLALHDGREDLRAGYYLWWFSFLGMAWLLWRSDRTAGTAAERAAA